MKSKLILRLHKKNLRWLWVSRYRQNWEWLPIFRNCFTVWKLWDKDHAANLIITSNLTQHVCLFPFSDRKVKDQGHTAQLNFRNCDDLLLTRYLQLRCSRFFDSVALQGFSKAAKGLGFPNSSLKTHCICYCCWS